LNYVHLQDNDTPDYGLPWLNNTAAPGPIRHDYYGFPDENYLQTNVDIMTLKVEHEFSPSVNLHMIARAAEPSATGADSRSRDLLERAGECASWRSRGETAYVRGEPGASLSLTTARAIRTRSW
jgi:hypothetical protein